MHCINASSLFPVLKTALTDSSTSSRLAVPVDMIGGTSIGVTIGVNIAQGLTADEAHSRVAKEFTSLIDFTLPITSMIAGKRIDRNIRFHVESWDIEDCWLPFYCVSTNLTSSKPFIHRRGNLARAVRSTISIPGVLPPVPKNGEFLVDGGVLNNLPIDVMRELNPSGVVIASDVNSPQGARAKEDYGTSLSGWRQLFDRIAPWKTAARAPSLAAVIMQSMMVGSNQARDIMLQQELADLYLNIHVRGVGILQFDAVEKTAQFGYDSVIGPLREWAASRE